jgi:hypothetical protein
MALKKVDLYLFQWLPLFIPPLLDSAFKTNKKSNQDIKAAIIQAKN